MSLKETIQNCLRSRFPEALFRFDGGSDLVASIDSPNEALGTIQIIVGSDEATIAIGEFTHGHFNRFDLDGDEADDAVALLIADFLADLFADRVVVWRRKFSGGWEIVPDGEPVEPHGEAESHVWTRPLRGA